MFDMQNISKKIAFYRRSKNLTQMELAEQMEVSFQAVSSWERGATMPDISRLPQLCGILEITIDELMDESPYLESVHKILSADKQDNEEISAEQLLDMEAIVKPEQMAEIFEEAKERLKFDSCWQIIGIIPFLDKESVNELVAAHTDLFTDFNQIAVIAPMLDRELLSNIVANLSSEASYDTMLMLAPCVSDETLAKLVMENIDEISSIENAANIAPFLPKETLEEIIERLPAKVDFSIFMRLVPFISREKAKALVMQNIEEFSAPDKLVSIAPFIDNEVFKKLIF